MKKLFLTLAISASCLLSVQAQSVLTNLLNSAANAAANGGSGKDIVGSVVNDAVGNATGDTPAGDLVSNLLTSIAGNVTTTQANLVGSWSYTQPAVQFTSENLLTQAGGAAIATKVENKLQTYYKMVGIKAGKMKFVFDQNGSVTYSVGKITRQGTYTFDSAEKMVTITTTAGANIRAHVTITGNVLTLTFDATKLMNLMTTLGSKFQSLSAITTLASAYDGMKIGFKFNK